MFDFVPVKPIPSDEDAEIQKRVWSSIKEIHKTIPLPPTFYHYTDAAGFKGFVESGTIRATHIAFMNDASEYLHAVSLLLNDIRQARKRVTNPLQIKLLDELEPPMATAQPQHAAPYFIACFSAKENDLNQWRA